MTQATDTPTRPARHGPAKFGIIDAPWDYHNFTDAKNGAADSAMETMSVEDIIALDGGQYFARNAYALFWGTWPKMPEALQVVEGWGFEFITAFPWVKTIPTTGVISRGIGFWTQGASEYAILARKGKPSRRKVACPDCGGAGCPKCKGSGKVTAEERVIGLLCGSENQFYAPRKGKHSAKPLELHAWAERLFPRPYVELFARERWPNPEWCCLGLETGWRLTPDGAFPIDSAPVIAPPPEPEGWNF